MKINPNALRQHSAERELPPGYRILPQETPVRWSWSLDDGEDIALDEQEFQLSEAAT